MSSVERMTFTDSGNRSWEVIDFRLEGSKKKRVRLGATNADGRAFRCCDDVRIYFFAQPFDYRSPEEKTLRQQFARAKPPELAAPAQPFQNVVEPTLSTATPPTADSFTHARGEIVGFFIARSTGVAVDVDNLKFRARARGVAHWRVETSYRMRGRPSQVHVTCHWLVAEQLRDEIRAAVETMRSERDRAAAERDVEAIETELADRLAPPKSYIPKDGMTGN